MLLRKGNGDYNRYSNSGAGESQRPPSISSNSPAHFRPGDITTSIDGGSTANNHFAPSPPSGASNNHDTPNNYHNSGGLSQSPAVETESRIEREHHFTNLVIEWSGGVALAAKNFPARMALDWILDDDPFRLTTSDKPLDVQQRYTAAVFYFATRGERWSSSRRYRYRYRYRRGRKTRRQRQLQQQSLHDDLYNAPHGSTHANSGNSAPAHFLTNRDVCLWKTSDGKSGIFCNDEGIIVKLTFRNFGLGGTLPQEVGYLNKLTSINIEDNDIAGTLPTQYGLLVNLERMGFENNNITGTIPNEFSNLKRLKELDLDGNRFTGTFPVHLCSLESIETIEISGSILMGSIPTELYNLSDTVQKIVLEDNKLTGNIPTELGTLTRLRYLDLGNNELTGTVPIQLSYATLLETLYLNGNDFAGSLNAAFCTTNNLSGRIFETLMADCQGASPEVKCSCCTSCCNANGHNCKEQEPIFVLDNNNTASSSSAIPTNWPTANNPANKPTPSPTIATIAIIQSSSSSSTASPVVVMSSQEVTFRATRLKELLATVSEQTLLESKHTSQFKAFMWMIRLDPSPVDAATTPHHEILQKYIVVLLYISTNGREWADQNSFLTGTTTTTGSSTVCGWDGLECNDENKIVSINLENNRLNGTLVSEIGSLGPNLRDLKLGNNLLFGEIPSEIGLLPGLRTLDLTNNPKITGIIPSEVSSRSLPNLKTIEIAGTGIVGSNLDSLFCSSKGDGGNDDDKPAIDIRANCLDPSVPCSCCLVCCDAAGKNCRAV